VIAAAIALGILGRICLAPVGVGHRKHEASARVLRVAHSEAVPVRVELEAGVLAWLIAAPAGALGVGVAGVLLDGGRRSRWCRKLLLHIAPVLNPLVTGRVL